MLVKVAYQERRLRRPCRGEVPEIRPHCGRQPADLHLLDHPQDRLGHLQWMNRRCEGTIRRMETLPGNHSAEPKQPETLYLVFGDGCSWARASQIVDTEFPQKPLLS